MPFAPRSATVVKGTPSWSNHAPGPALRRYVSAFWSIQLRGRSPIVRTLPDGCVDLVVDLSGPPHAYLAGPQRKATTWRLERPVHFVGARLFPGVATLWGIDVGALPPRWVALDSYLAAVEVRRLERTIAQAKDVAGRVHALEAFLARTLSGLELDPCLVRALDAIMESGGTVTVSALAKAAHVEPRTLGRLFRGHVGLGPKRFARIVRFQRALAALEHEPNGAQLAADLGYFDQAHFIREVNEMFGEAPRIARKRTSLTR